VSNYRKPYVLYELPISSLILTTKSGASIEMNEGLSNGRANYVLFQSLVARCTGLLEGSEGAASDLSEGHEVKAYYDHELYPENDDFQTSASSTFGANNKGPIIKRLLAEGDYGSALKICTETGYEKNQAYVYTNTRKYIAEVPFRYIIVPKDDVLEMLSKDDPRLISRDAILKKVAETIQIDPSTFR
jgi:hypothetical protein